jgi:single-strand DNA-binding protein
MSINKSIISGNLVRDAEEKRTQSGMVIVTFTVASNERRKNNQTGEWDDYPNYIDVTWFGSRAEKCKGYLVKGAKVTVEGHLRQERWEKDGLKREKLGIILDDIELPQRQYNPPQQARPAQVPQFEEVQTSVYDADIPF